MADTTIIESIEEQYGNELTVRRTYDPYFPLSVEMFDITPNNLSKKADAMVFYERMTDGEDNILTALRKKYGKVKIPQGCKGILINYSDGVSRTRLCWVQNNSIEGINLRFNIQKKIWEPTNEWSELERELIVTHLANYYNF